MKRLIIVFTLLLVSLAAFASEELDIYTYMYQDSTTTQERLSILQSVAEAKIEGAGQLFAGALSQLLREQPTLRTMAEKDAADVSARLLAGLLGEAKYSGAAGDLWRVVQSFANPLVKADALIALGRIRSPDYLEQVVRLLADLNLKPADDPEAGGKIAYGAVLALEKYQQPEGYLPVFFASTGWYPRRIRDQAVKSLPFIVADPSQPLSTIIGTSSYTYDVKYLALQKEEESAASNEAKAALAALAYSEAWRAITTDVKQRVTLANSRKLAIDMLRRYKSADAGVITLLERSYKEGIDMEESLSAVAALAAIGSDEAARALVSFLNILNGKRKDSRVTQEDERLVRAVIPALGATGKPIGRPVLRLVGNLDWTNAVKVLATEALKKLE